jgi:integrase
MPKQKKTAGYRQGPRLLSPKKTGLPCWVIRWSTPSGTRQVSTRQKRELEAQEAFREWKAQNPELCDPASAGGAAGRLTPITLAEGAELWLQSKRPPVRLLRPSTLAQYERACQLLIDYLPRGIKARDVRRDHLTRFLRHLGAEKEEGGIGLGPTSIKKAAGLVTSLFTFLEVEEKISRNPARGLAARWTTTERSKPIGEVPEEVYLRLIAALEEDIEAAGTAAERAELEELRDVLELLWWTGWRSIEAYRLKWADCRLKDGLVTIHSPRNKGGSSKRPLHPQALAVLRRRKLLGGEGPFLASGASSLQHRWHRYKRSRGFAEVHLHGFRYAFISRLARAGQHLAASFLVGHHSMTQTHHYSQLTPEDVRKVLDQLA